MCRPSCVASENDTIALRVPHVFQSLFELLHYSRLTPFACLRAPARVSLSCLFPPLFTHAVRLSFYVTVALQRVYLALEPGCGVMCAPQALSAQLRHSASRISPMWVKAHATIR